MSRKKYDFRAVQRSALCKSRRELSNEYLLAKFRFDTAENELSKVCPAVPADAERQGGPPRHAPRRVHRGRLAAAAERRAAAAARGGAALLGREL